MDEKPTTFPKDADRQRLAQYQHYNKLYAGDHFSAFSITLEDDFTKRYAKIRYIAVNFPGLMSRIIANMLFGDKIRIDFKDKQNQEFANKLIERNQLFTQLFEAALIASRLGDDVFRLRFGKRNPNDPYGKNEIIIEEFNPALYYPEFDEKATRNTPTKDVVCRIFTRDKQTYLHKETQTPGVIINEVFQYYPDKKEVGAQINDLTQFGLIPLEKTMVKSRTLIFPLANVRDGSQFFGTSDYADLDVLFFAINNRVTKLDNILDKHSDPILAVPPGVIDEEGKVKKQALGMFEVDNETPGFNKPEYIVWDANLDAGFKEVDKLVEFIYTVSEISPALIGLDKGGIAESGRALKYKILSTIRKRNRKIQYFDQMIKDLLETAFEMAIAVKAEFDGVKPASVERPNIIWGDGVINDETEMTDTVIKRVEAGLMSTADGIAALDGLDPDDAKKKAKEIEAEQVASVPPVVNTLKPIAPTPVPAK